LWQDYPFAVLNETHPLIMEGAFGSSAPSVYQSVGGGGGVSFINISLYDMMYHYDQTALLKIENDGNVTNFNNYKAEVLKLKNKRNPASLLYQDYTDYYSPIQYNHVFKFGEEDYTFGSHLSEDFSDKDGYALSSLVITENVEALDSSIYRYGHSHGEGADLAGNVGAGDNMMMSFLRVGHEALNFNSRTSFTKAANGGNSYIHHLERSLFGTAGYGWHLQPNIWRPIFRTSSMPMADPNFIPKMTKGEFSSAVSSIQRNDKAIGLCPTCEEQEFFIGLAPNSITTAVNFYIENMIDLSKEDALAVKLDGEWNNPDASPVAGTNAPASEEITCSCVETGDQWYCECSDGTRYGQGGELNSSYGYSQQDECVGNCPPAS